MIDVTDFSDLNAELLVQIELLLREFLTEKSDCDEDQYQRLLDCYKDWTIDPRIIGKEQNSVIIFTWQCTECPFAKTFIASYNFDSKFSKLLLHQEKVITVVNASLNINDTLLGFTTVECVSMLEKTRTLTSQNFNAFIAEIHPQNRIFSLNVEWTTYQKVQFLNNYCNTDQTKFNMLFFNHKNSIQIYNLCVDNKDLGKVTLLEQPKTQQVAGSFIWAKFDTSNYRLYYVQLLPQDEVEIEAAAVLNAIEFKSDGAHEYIMSFILPIKLKMELMKKQSSYHIDQYLITVSCKSFNLDILTESRGSLYICFQHPVVDNRNIKEESSEDDQSTISESSSSHDSILQTSDTNGNLIINYSIICIHGGYTVNCSSILPVPTPNTRICFTLFNDYLMVFLPSSFLHLLDISCEHEPVHNLLIRKKDYLPQLPSQCPYNSLFTPCYLIDDMEESTPLIYEAQTQAICKIKLNAANLYKYFLSSKSPTRISVLHACVNHFQHKKLIKKILERICQDPSNIDSSQMLKEFLILSPYVELKGIVNQMDLKVYPLTTQSCYRGQVERNSEGHRDVYLSYKLFKNDLITQIRKVLRHCGDVFWKNVNKHMTFEDNYRNKRVPLNVFYMAAVNDIEKPMPSTVARAGRRNTSFLIVNRHDDDNVVTASQRDTAKDDSVLEDNRKTNERLNKLASHCFVNYLSKVFGEEMKNRAGNVCLQYMELRFESIIELWKIALHALGHTDECIRFSGLNTPTGELEIAIFQVVERLKVICDQLCYPKLPNMNDLMCTLSYRCLNYRQFARYLDTQVIKADMNWVRRALNELPEGDDKTEIIMDIIKRLNKAEAHKLLLEWNNPVGNRYLSEHISWKMPCDALLFRNNTFELINQNAQELIPLKTLLHGFKAHCKPSTIFGAKGSDKKQNDFLQNTALSNTNKLLE